MHANLALLLAVPLLAGCGALMRPGPFRMPVDSQPRGATVVYAGKKVGVTPCVVAMQRSSSELELRHDGCRPRIVQVGTRANGWVAGNIFTLGLGMFVDMALGTDVNLVDDPVLVRLASTEHPPLEAWVRAGPVPIMSPPGTCRRESCSQPACSNDTDDRTGQLIGALLECLINRRCCRR